jgi:hypothetical protein
LVENLLARCKLAPPALHFEIAALGVGQIGKRVDVRQIVLLRYRQNQSLLGGLPHHVIAPWAKNRALDPSYQVTKWLFSCAFSIAVLARPCPANYGRASRGAMVQRI